MQSILLFHNKLWLYQWNVLLTLYFCSNSFYKCAILALVERVREFGYRKRGKNKMISYKKLWKVLIDKDLKKKDLVTLAGVSTYTINKLNRGDNVTTDVLQRICKALNCNIGDIMDIVDEPKNQ